VVQKKCKKRYNLVSDHVVIYEKNVQFKNINLTYFSTKRLRTFWVTLFYWEEYLTWLKLIEPYHLAEVCYAKNTVDFTVSINSTCHNTTSNMDVRNK